MQTILFTKLFRGQSIEKVGSAAQDMGFEGIDLLIRPGFHVEPDKPDTLLDAVRSLKNAGLAVPMATTDITDLSQFPTEQLFPLCAEVDIRLIRRLRKFNVSYEEKHCVTKSRQRCFPSWRD